MREVRLVSDSSKKETGKEDDDDIIIIEDSTSKGSEKKRKEQPERRISSSKELCTYHREAVTEHDYKTLADEEFLNDNIINFYLTWLYQNLPAKFKDIVHIYSSHFYSRLRSKPSKNDTSKKTRAELAYEKVKGWTKKINIFEKRMLIFPICEESHWYLVIVCNPGHVLSQTREKDFEAKRSYQLKFGETRGHNPFIMVLDSLGGSHSTAVSKIRSYLTFEHIEKKKVPMNFGKEKMAEKHPPIPLQPNSCDCGLFLLHYVELIFKDPEMFLGAMLPDLSRWFNTSDIEYKREDIAMVIQKIANENNSRGIGTIRFPKIKFPAHRRILDRVEATEKVSDPRLKKVSKGTLGELLADKRASRFTGSYALQEGLSSRSKSPTRSSSRTRDNKSSSEESSRSPRSRAAKFTGTYCPGSPKSRSASPIEKSPAPPKKISFEIKKKVHTTKSPDLDDFQTERQKRIESSRRLLAKLDENDFSSSENGGGQKTLNKRFSLKRYNSETNPEHIRSRRIDDEEVAKNRQDMYDFLMKSTSSSKKRRTQ